jgi:hypothetical protein
MKTPLIIIYVKQTLAKKTTKNAGKTISCFDGIYVLTNFIFFAII